MSMYANTPSNNSISASPAMQRFLESMKIDYYKWHDGIGYDLEALKDLQPSEIKEIESLMIARKDVDWREVECLAALNTPAAIEALFDCLHSHNNDVKLFAVRYLKEMNIADKVDDVVVETLPRTVIGDGMTFALDLARDYPSDRIKCKVLWCTLYGNDDIRIFCAAMTLYLFKITESTFDYDYPIIYDFRETDLLKRIPSFEKLCRMIGVDPKPITEESAC